MAKGGRGGSRFLGANWKKGGAVRPGQGGDMAIQRLFLPEQGRCNVPSRSRRKASMARRGGPRCPTARGTAWPVTGTQRVSIFG